MTCKPDLHAAACIALLLSLVGCSGGEAQDRVAIAAEEPADPATQWRARGRDLMASGKLAEAGAAFDRALSRQPDDPGLWVDIAGLRYRGGEQEQALDAVGRALAIDPDDPEALLFRGQIARDAQGLKAGLAWFERGLRAHPDHPGLLRQQAATLIDLDRATEGLAALRKLAEIEPDAPEIAYLQAVIAARGGAMPLAHSLLQRVAPDLRQGPAAMLLEGVVMLETGQHASAAQTFDALLALQPDNAQVARLLARALLLAGNRRELTARFEPRVQEDASSTYLRLTVGRALEDLDRRADAAPFLDDAARPATMTLVPLGPTAPAAVARQEDGATGAAARDFIRQSLRLGLHGDAVTRARRFVAAAPGSGDARSLLGDALLASGDGAGALSAYRRAARIRQGWPLTLRLVAAHRAAGDMQGARQALAAYLRGGGNEMDAMVLHARMEAEAGRLNAAARMLDIALSRGGTRDPAVLALRSTIALSGGDRAGAVRFAYDAYSLQPLHPSAIAALMRATDDAVLRQRLSDKLDRLPSG